MAVRTLITLCNHHHCLVLEPSHPPRKKPCNCHRRTPFSRPAPTAANVIRVSSPRICQFWEFLVSGITWQEPLALTSLSGRVVRAHPRRGLCRALPLWLSDMSLCRHSTLVISSRVPAPFLTLVTEAAVTLHAHVFARMPAFCSPGSVPTRGLSGSCSNRVFSFEGAEQVVSMSCLWLVEPRGYFRPSTQRNLLSPTLPVTPAVKFFV